MIGDDISTGHLDVRHLAFGGDDGLAVTVRLPLTLESVDADLTHLLRFLAHLASTHVDGDGGDDGEDLRSTLRIVPAARAVYRGGREIQLTRREFDLLWHLAAHPRQVFTRDQLLDRVWGSAFAGARSVDVHVRRVRVKVGTDLPVICTVRGIGYRLGSAVPVQILRDPG